MTRKLSIGLVAIALLASGALVGVSFAGSGGITQPEVIELSTDICGGPGPCRFYPLRETGVRRPNGQITVAKNPISDVDGNEVGHVNTFCMASVGRDGPTNWVCSLIVKLTAGPYTQRGTITATGIYGIGDDDFEVHAVTGGTGAYENVRGTIRQEQHRGVNFILNLLP